MYKLENKNNGKTMLEFKKIVKIINIIKKLD